MRSRQGIRLAGAIRHHASLALGAVARHAGLAVVAVALLVAVGGVSYAAGTINSKDITDNSIKSVDLKDGAAVAGVDVVNGSLTGADIAESTLAGVAHRIQWFAEATSGTSWTPLLTLADLSFDARCRLAGANTHLELRKRGPGLIIDQIVTQVVFDTPPETNPATLTRSQALDAGPLDMIDTMAVSGYNTRDIGTQFLRWGIRLATFDFNTLSGTTQGNECFAEGTMTLGV